MLLTNYLSKPVFYLKMASEHEIRKARIKDSDRLYEICCAVELEADPERMARDGFLMTQYSQQPEMRKYISNLVRDGLMCYVAETAGEISGWLVAYPKSEWEKRGWSSDVLWEGSIDPAPALEGEYTLLEKIAVHPDFRRRGIATVLFDHFAASLGQETNYVFMEIIEGLFRKQNSFLISQGISNKVSIAVARSFGGVKVGHSRVPYGYDGSYLGSAGQFVDGVYLVDLGKRASPD